MNDYGRVAMWQRNNPRMAAFVGGFFFGLALCGYWIWRIVSCEVLRAHDWVWDAALRVPCYGTGHHRCFVCRRVRVRP